MPALELIGLRAGYGAREVLHGISFSVEEGSIVALLGANGAGKSTVLRAVSGLIEVPGGMIRLAGRDLGGVPAQERVRRGLGHVPEGRRVFPRLTVRENLLMGGYLCDDPAELERRRARVDALFPVLRERDGQPGGTLSGGEQQMLAIGRALMGAPAILLLDEPSLGLAPRIIGQIGEVIAAINRQGTAVLLVEQNATMALGVADLAYVLDVGEVSLSGNARELAQTDEVQRLYLGHDGDSEHPKVRATSGKKLSRWTA